MQSRRIQRLADTVEIRCHREEEYCGYGQVKPRQRFEIELKSTPHLNPRGPEFKSIRLATRIQEWYQKGFLRINDTDQAVQPRYL